MTVHVLGVRHHGPGSARSLVRALAEIGPDCVLVEGPPDADAAIGFAARADLVPPVALLVHDASEPRRAVFYPFAAFSPEWQALRLATHAGIAVRFMDLPHAHRMALDAAAEAAAAERGTGSDGSVGTGEPGPAVEDDFGAHADPLEELAAAAGHASGEAWWEHIVEHRRDGADVFAAVREAMTAVREELAPGSLGPEPPVPTTAAGLEEARREAWMRRTVRAAQKEGFERIVVVCGAWHAPALLTPPKVKWDAALLRGLPRTKVEATWVPWTHARLARESGYGAGVRSPGWYAHLWTTERDVGARWLGRAARCLRAEGLDASSAHVVEALRLAEATAALRGLAHAGPEEYEEAIRSVFLGGDVAPLALLRRRLVVGEELGSVPSDVPTVPLRRDLAAHQTSLRVKPQAVEKTFDLDLRRETDRARSHLWHRLALLDVPWAQRVAGRTGAGTFHEHWQVQWAPECEVAVVDAARWGNTVDEAAAARVRAVAATADLPRLAALIDDVLLADLRTAADDVLARLASAAAVAADVGTLLRALPPLASTLRYGSVRKLDADALRPVVRGIAERAAVGLLAACQALDEDAARAIAEEIAAAHGALAVLGDDAPAELWHAALERVAAHDDLNGLLVGAVTRLLLDAGRIAADDAAVRLRRALSRTADAAAGAAWIEGFLRGSGTLLVHDPRVRGIVDAWLTGLSAEHFEATLPLLRRTTSRFTAPERRAIGAAVRSDASGAVAAARGAPPIDTSRADGVLPVVRLLLGLPAAAGTPS